MRITQRREPGRLVLRIEDIDPGDRVAARPAELIRIDLGRRKVTHPITDLDQPEYAPVRVVHDPLGREWTELTYSDHGDSVELSTPMED